MATSPRRPGGSRRRFPPVEDQLRAARVEYGSALEQLVRDNQDISLLRPEESEDDGIDIPLWLRVHYRKNHPELIPAPAGAVGDYPEALENLHEWMKTHQDLGQES
jgi:hypothetical protein